MICKSYLLQYCCLFQKNAIGSVPQEPWIETLKMTGSRVGGSMSRMSHVACLSICVLDGSADVVDVVYGNM